MEPVVIKRAPLADGPAGGRGAVLVHGAMDRASSFGRLMTRMADWTIITYDRRGYGRSSGLAPAEDFETAVADLISVLERAGVEGVVAFGHSFGGDVVLAAMATRAALIRSAVAWEPPQPWRPGWPADRQRQPAGDPAAAAESFMRRMVGDRIWERLPASTREQRRSEGPALLADMRALERGAPFDPTRVRGPVLVGRGGRSRVHHRRAVRELASELPQGELVEIAEADHGAHLTHPAELAEFMQRAGRACP